MSSFGVYNIRYAGRVQTSYEAQEANAARAY